MFSVSLQVDFLPFALTLSMAVIIIYKDIMGFFWTPMIFGGKAEKAITLGYNNLLMRKWRNLVDALDLGSSPSPGGGSNPPFRR